MRGSTGCSQHPAIETTTTHSDPSAREQVISRRAPKFTDGAGTEENWASYSRAVIDITPPGRTPFRLWPDALGATGVWMEPLAEPVVIVTAWNPGSILRPLADNVARNRLLVAELDRAGVTRWPAVGRDPDTEYHEDGFAVSGLTLAEGVTLGARHGQVAVYVWTPAAWTVVSCSDDRCHSSGWRLTERLSDKAGPATF